MRRLSWLTASEVISVVAWLALIGVYLFRGGDDGHLVPINVEALVQGATAEEWTRPEWDTSACVCTWLSGSRQADR